jgi:uncharacterized membrane protein
MRSATERLDAFADAAFAFAVSLMVVGGNATAPDYASLLTVMQAVPSFAIGFAIIAMFWFAHVRWRQLRGEGDWRSTLLTMALIFAVLVYVHPLRAMSTSFAAFLGGQTDTFGRNLPNMFAIYGIGFFAMSALMAGLYREVLNRPEITATQQRAAKGETIIWLVMALTGLVSAAMSQWSPLAYWAAFAYASLPLTIGVFASQWQWTAPSPAAPDTTGTPANAQ